MSDSQKYRCEQCGFESGQQLRNGLNNHWRKGYIPGVRPRSEDAICYGHMRPIKQDEYLAATIEELELGKKNFPSAKPSWRRPATTPPGVFLVDVKCRTLAGSNVVSDYEKSFDAAIKAEGEKT